MDYSNCLCYTPEEGIFIKSLLESDKPSELIFRPYTTEGWSRNNRKSNIINIPNEDVKIHIKSNFGYGKSSFLYATMKNKERIILDFDVEKLQVLNYCSVSTLSVKSRDWDSLFRKIINYYKEPWSSTEVFTYIEELGNLLDKDEINIKANMIEKEFRTWKGTFLVTSHVARKLHDLLDSIELSKMNDQDINDRILALCHKFLLKIKGVEIDPLDLRASHFSNALFSIHKFMENKGKGIDFFSYFISKSEITA